VLFGTVYCVEVKLQEAGRVEELGLPSGLKGGLALQCGEAEGWRRD
jgi:hypothetical protein